MGGNDVRPQWQRRWSRVCNSNEELIVGIEALVPSLLSSSPGCSPVDLYVGLDFLRRLLRWSRGRMSGLSLRSRGGSSDSCFWVGLSESESSLLFWTWSFRLNFAYNFQLMSKMLSYFPGMFPQTDFLLLLAVLHQCPPFVEISYSATWIHKCSESRSTNRITQFKFWWNWKLKIENKALQLFTCFFLKFLCPCYEKMENMTKNILWITPRQVMDPCLIHRYLFTLLSLVPEEHISDYVNKSYTPH